MLTADRSRPVKTRAAFAFASSGYDKADPTGQGGPAGRLRDGDRGAARARSIWVTSGRGRSSRRGWSCSTTHVLLRERSSRRSGRRPCPGATVPQGDFARGGGGLDKTTGHRRRALRAWTAATCPESPPASASLRHIDLIGATAHAQIPIGGTWRATAAYHRRSSSCVLLALVGPIARNAGVDLGPSSTGTPAKAPRRERSDQE